MASISDTCATCTCSVCEKIRFTIAEIFRALDVYGWILDAYVVDFFQDKLWNKLPSSWQTFLDEITPEDLGNWILKERGRSPRVWPLSLLALRKFIEISEIPRNHKEDCLIKCSYNDSSKRKQNSDDDAGQIERQTSSCTIQYDNLFAKHVKKKKRYEIDVMSQRAVDCAKRANCECIVDIGSGMGHLARVLAYKHNFCATCIEQNEALLDGARKWDEELMTSLTKHISDFRGRKPHHVSLQVGVSSEARRQLADQLASIFIENFEIAPEDSGFGLIGLHPCGDLAATLLRFYSSEKKARFICIVGCCYMKLSREGLEKGYPMSRHLSAINNNHELSYAALEVACHAVEKHCDKLKENSYNDLIVHAYRAALECLLIEKNPDLRRTQLKNAKIKQETSFKQYCEAVTECLESECRPVDADFERRDVKSLLQQWKRVVIFGSLRFLLAPLVETVVLFDRFLYLSELNLMPSLKAEFDSRISPRNFLLTAVKEKKPIL